MRNDHAEVLATAEHSALLTLEELAAGCRFGKILTGSTKRGPAFVYVCPNCGGLAVVSVPADGLRNHDPGDPTARTRVAIFIRDEIILETGAFIESDGTVRARFVVHLPGGEEPEWEITADRAAAVGAAVQAMSPACPAPDDVPPEAGAAPAPEN